MAGFPNELKVRFAVRGRNNFPLDHVHQTTSDFGITQVTEIMPLVPTDVVDINIDTYARLMPLLSPTMGKCDIIHRAFFVPHDFVCADWKAFISQHALNEGSISSNPTLPRFGSVDLFNIFYDVHLTHVPSSSSYDKWLTSVSSSSVSEFIQTVFDIYICHDSSGNPLNPPTAFDYGPLPLSASDSIVYVYFRFKPLGKIIYNILLQLGYSVSLAELENNDSYSDNSFSLLPLYSLVKIYIDYYVDPRYNWNAFSEFFRQFTSELWLGYDAMDRARAIHDMLVLCAYSWFQNDLFTSAWLSQESSAPFGMFRSVVVNSGDGIHGSHVYAAGDGRASSSDSPGSVSAVSDTYAGVNPSTSAGGTSIVRISQHMLDVLKSVSDFFKRNNIAGTRPIDILLARFGVHQPELLAGRSQYLGSFSAPVSIADVMATAAGSNSVQDSVVGDYAGKGVISDQRNFHIHFENKYFYGYLIVVSHILPRTMYFEGVKPHVLFSDAFDFFTPEIEDTGTEPLPNRVVYDNAQVNVPAGFNYDGVFGFVPHYYAYKFGFDTLSGDFRLKRYYNSLRSFQMFREVTDFENPSKDDIVNNQSFKTFNDRARELYDKMFVSQSIDEDHFIINHVIRVNANRPMQGIGRSLVGDLVGSSREVGIRPNGKYF